MRFLLFDINDNYIEEIKDLMYAKNTEELDREDILELSVLEHVEKGNRILLFDRRRQVFKEYNVEGVIEERTDGGIIYNVYAESSWYETIGDYIDNLKFESIKLREVASKILEHSPRWELGKVEDEEKFGTLYLYHTSVNTAIHDLLLVWNMEMETDVRYDSETRKIIRKINIVKKRGNNKGRRLSYTNEVKSIRRETLRDDIVTAIYPYGAGVPVSKAKNSSIIKSVNRTKNTIGTPNPNDDSIMTNRVDISTVNDGKLFIENTDALQKYGRLGPDGKKIHFSKVMIYDNIDDAAKLKQAAQQDLERLSSPRFSYDVSIMSMYHIDNSEDYIELGDDVNVIDRDFNPPISITTRVLRVERDLIDEENTELILGELIRDFSDIKGDNRVYEIPSDMVEDFEGNDGGNVGGEGEYVSVDELLQGVPSLKIGLSSWIDVNKPDSVIMNAGGDIAMIKDAITGETVYEQPIFDRRPSLSIINNNKWISFNPDPITYRVWKGSPTSTEGILQEGEYFNYLKSEDSIKTAIAVYISRLPEGQSVNGLDYGSGHGFPIGYGSTGQYYQETKFTGLSSIGYYAEKLPNRKEVEAIICANYTRPGYTRATTSGVGLKGPMKYLGMNKEDYDISVSVSKSGYNRDYYNANAFFAGEIAEVILFNREIDAYEANALEAYFSRKYGAELVLDGSIGMKDWSPSSGMSIPYPKITTD